MPWGITTIFWGITVLIFNRCALFNDKHFRFDVSLKKITEKFSRQKVQGSHDLSPLWEMTWPADIFLITSMEALAERMEPRLSLRLVGTNMLCINAMSVQFWQKEVTQHEHTTIRIHCYCMYILFKEICAYQHQRLPHHCTNRNTFIMKGWSWSCRGLLSNQ